MKYFRQRLYEILMQDDVVNSIRNNLEELTIIIPEIKYMIGFPHNHPHHHLDVFEHTLLALSLSNKDFEERLCLLLHDIGKPFSYQDEEVRHFKNHALVSSNMSYDILTRLEYDKEFIKEVVYLIKYHDTPITNREIEENYELVFTRYQIQKCDALAHNPLKLEKRIKYLKEFESKLEEFISQKNVLKIKKI